MAYIIFCVIMIVVMIFYETKLSDKDLEITRLNNQFQKHLNNLYQGIEFENATNDNYEKLYRSMIMENVKLKKEIDELIIWKK